MNLSRSFPSSLTYLKQKKAGQKNKNNNRNQLYDTRGIQKSSLLLKIK